MIVPVSDICTVMKSSALQAMTVSLSECTIMKSVALLDQWVEVSRAG